MAELKVIDVNQKKPEPFLVGDNFTVGVILRQRSTDTGEYINHTGVSITDAQVTGIFEKADPSTNLLASPTTILNSAIDHEFQYKKLRSIMIPFRFDAKNIYGTGNYMVLIDFRRDNIDDRRAIVFIDVKPPKHLF